MIATNLDEKFTRIVTKQIAKVVKAEGWTEELKSEIVRIDSKHDFMTVAFNLGYLATAFLILDGKTGYWTYRSENLPYHKIFCDRTLDEAAELMIQDWYDSDFSGLNQMLHPDFSKFKVGDFVALGSFVYVNGKPYPRFSEIEVIMIKRGKLVLSNGWEVKIKNREVIGTLYKLAYHADDVNLVLSKLKDNIPKK